MINRRTFIKQTSILTAGTFISSSMPFGKSLKYKAGLQLFTLRDYTAKDIKGVITKVAKAGYQAVETVGYELPTHTFFGLAPSEFSNLLKENGLTTASGHYSMSPYLIDGDEDRIKHYIDAAHALGQTYIVGAWIEPNLRKTKDDFRVIAAKLNKIGELCKRGGMQLAFHNHDYEFAQKDGVKLFDVLMTETEPSNLQFEMDIYWVVRAGQDPVNLIKLHPGRFPLWHLKDMDKAKPELNTEIGKGGIDFKAIAKYADLSGLKHVFMEQENFSMDAFDSIKQSAQYIRKDLF